MTADGIIAEPPRPARFWDVGGSIPPKSEGNDKTWARTLVLHVVAMSASEAIEAVVAKYPAIAVHTVQHRGAIDIIYAVPKDALQ